MEATALAKIQKKIEITEGEKMTPEMLLSLEKELLGFLEKGEDTPNKVLIRLRGQVKPQVKAKGTKNVRKKQKLSEEEGKDVQVSEGKEAEKGGLSEEEKKRFERLVEICDLICTAGTPEIYLTSKDDLATQVRVEEKELEYDKRMLQQQKDSAAGVKRQSAGGSNPSPSEVEKGKDAPAPPTIERSNAKDSVQGGSEKEIENIKSRVLQSNADKDEDDIF
eukprot:TRINITY_DN8189_c0_g2_i6.p1 TRINITY_DN8189_c0_g2~~TRINITY_DN8189_c0_g2_i6.p1  ORF type:complete len:221 (+),score=45.41 TRINITY_DN8189_c0_g2_i6:194-856(+)